MQDLVAHSGKAIDNQTPDRWLWIGHRVSAIVMVHPSAVMTPPRTKLNTRNQERKGRVVAFPSCDAL